MQAICDHTLKFFWVEIQWPAATSDYMAWTTSALCRMLEENEVTRKIIEGFTIIGNCAYVKKMYMATPLKAANHYRVCIWSFGPSMGYTSRTPDDSHPEGSALLIKTLVCLHNYCIDENEDFSCQIQDRNAAYLDHTVSISLTHGGKDTKVVELDNLGRPASLLDLGHHYADAESCRHDRALVAINNTPIDEILERIRKLKRRRPKLGK
ncbi:hypothetical protein ACHAWF_006765 [Thalassiosira exigua]